MMLNDCTRMLLTVAIVVLLVHLLNGSTFEGLTDGVSESEPSIDNSSENEVDDESSEGSESSEPIGVDQDSVNYDSYPNSEPVENKFDSSGAPEVNGSGVWSEVFNSSNNYKIKPVFISKRGNSGKLNFLGRKTQAS